MHAQAADTKGFLLAARRNDGALTVLMVNASERVRRETLTVSGWNESTAQVWRFGLETRLAPAGTVSLTEPIAFPGMTATLLVSGGAAKG